MEKSVHINELSFGMDESSRFYDDLIFEADITPAQLAKLTCEFDVRGRRSHTWASSASDEFREVLKCSKFAAFNARRLEDLSRAYTTVEKGQLEQFTPPEKEASNNNKRTDRLTPVSGVNTKRIEELTQVYDANANPLEKTRLEYFLGINLDNFLKSKCGAVSESTPT